MIRFLLNFFFSGGEGSGSIGARFRRIDWSMALIVSVIAVFGTILLYGAAGGSWQPWALDHITRFGLFMIIMIIVALTDIRIWYHLAYPAYFIAIILLLGVAFAGDISKGAKRWISLGPIRIQPSEFVKIAVILALARFYQDSKAKKIGAITSHLIPILMILFPAGLIMKQPDLGTGSTVLFIGAIMILLSGVSWKWVTAAIGAAITIGYVGFHFLMHDFQRQRILVFMNPEAFRSAEGYQITQSKIAIGSGGFFGVGYMNGSQSQLDFLPERHTDFVFSMLLEEFGMIGGLVALLLYFSIIFLGILIATKSRSFFGKMLASGVTFLLLIYVGINGAMVMGLLPVVGMPMPFLSYGGSVMLSVMFALGLLQNVSVNREKTLATSFEKK